MSFSDRNSKNKGRLFVVATPIGNLEDITIRAIEILKQVPLIACEDTRQTRKLMNRYGIKGRLVSYHKFNERAKVDAILDHLQKGHDIALVSDAGTPGISDPGYLLVKSVLERGWDVIPVPGPSALTALLSVSGFPLSSFSFYGFLPKKRKERRKFLESLRLRRETLIFFEAPHRIVQTLSDLLQAFGPRAAMIGREITKRFEEKIRGNLQKIVEHFKDRPQVKRQGEYTIIIGGASREERKRKDIPAYDYFLELVEDEGIDRKEAIKIVSREIGIPKSQVYKEILEKEGKG